MSSSTQPVEVHSIYPGTGPQPHLQQHQKTTISIFTENGIDPKNIVKAAQHGGVQNLLQETERIVVIADTWQTLYDTDIKLLIQLYKKYNRSILEACLNELVQMSQQGLLQAKQGFENEATPADSPTDEEHVITTSTGKKPKYSSKTAGKGPKSPARTSLRRFVATVGKRPLSSSTAAKRVVTTICSPDCHQYVKKQHFINHARLNHQNKLPSAALKITCCDKAFEDEVAYLDHHWEEHSEILLVKATKADTKPHEDLETPRTYSWTPTGESDTEDY